MLKVLFVHSCGLVLVFSWFMLYSARDLFRFYCCHRWQKSLLSLEQAVSQLQFFPSICSVVLSRLSDSILPSTSSQAISLSLSLATETPVPVRKIVAFLFVVFVFNLNRFCHSFSFFLLFYLSITFSMSFSKNNFLSRHLIIKKNDTDLENYTLWFIWLTTQQTLAIFFFCLRLLLEVSLTTTFCINLLNVFSQLLILVAVVYYFDWWWWTVSECRLMP